MWTFKFTRSKRCMISLVAITGAFMAQAGSVGGFGGATEVTQFANNAELVKVSLDSAQTSAYTVSQYMTQLEQYRYQIQNTLGIDPMRMTSSLAQIDNQYQQSRNYLFRINAVRGSLAQQDAAYQQRYDAARLRNMSMNDYIAFEQTRLDQKNQTAIELNRQNQAIIEQNQRNIEELNASQREIPGDLSTNAAIQSMHSTLGRLAISNAGVVNALTIRNKVSIDESSESATKANEQKGVSERTNNLRKQLEARQQQFLNNIGQ